MRSWKVLLLRENKPVRCLEKGDREYLPFSFFLSHYVALAGLELYRWPQKHGDPCAFASQALDQRRGSPHLAVHLSLLHYADRALLYYFVVNLLSLNPTSLEMCVQDSVPSVVSPALH